MQDSSLPLPRKWKYAESGILSLHFHIQVLRNTKKEPRLFSSRLLRPFFLRLFSPTATLLSLSLSLSLSLNIYKPFLWFVFNPSSSFFLCVKELSRLGAEVESASDHPHGLSLLVGSAMEEDEDWACCSNETETEDQEIYGLKEWNDEEESRSNPYKPSSGSIPKLQLRKNVSKARWDEDMGMAEVTEKKGSMWTTTGIIQGGKLYCLLEEILFLAERGALLLFDANDTALSLTDIYEKVAKNKYGCSWESFEVYRHLKSLGYIINRHGLPWTLKINKNCCNSKSLRGTLESDDTSKPNGEDETVSILCQLKEMRINEMKPNFDVYLPNGKFRKSAPGNPSFILYLLSDDPPSTAEIQVLEKECKGIPMKFCHLEHGRVSFFSFDKVELPDPSLLDDTGALHISVEDGGRHA